MFNAGQYIVAKVIYDRYPSINPFQLVLIRSCFSLVYLLIGMNVKVKQLFIDEYRREFTGPLIFRSLQSSISSIINMVAVYYIDVVVVSLVNNTTPVFVCLLAMCFLGERLKIAEVVFMTMTFVCIIVIIAGEGTSTTSNSYTFKEVPLVYIAMFCNPILSAGGSIAQKKLSAMSELTATFWPQLCTALVCLVFLIWTDSDWDSIEDMPWLGWVLSGINGSLIVF